MERKTLGKRINIVRKSLNITAEQLSERCHINATYLRQIEGGAKMPSLPVFVDICNALKISPDYLLQDQLDTNELCAIRELTELWQNSTPARQSIVIAMLKTALLHTDMENKEPS